MTFTLTEDDFNALDSIKGQLAFVNALVSSHRATTIEVNPSDFAEFLSQLEATASRLVDTLLQRLEEARQH